MMSSLREHWSYRAVLPALLAMAILLILLGWLISSGSAHAQERAGGGPPVTPVAAGNPLQGSTPSATSTCTPIWNIVPSPSFNVNLNSLKAVSVASANDVWAVGDYGNFRNLVPEFHALAEHWDGVQWSVVPVVDEGWSSSGFGGVAALSANDVWTAGSYSTSDGNHRALIEHWNGTLWSVVPSPSPGTGSGLIHIAALAANDIWAVGSFSQPGAGSLTLVEHWDGTLWSIVPSPIPGTSSGLTGVSARSAGDVWAVGSYFDGTKSRTLIEHWDGARWSVVPSPSPGTCADQLYDVTAISANDVWAAGYTDSGRYQTLVEHWDGSTWSLVPSPNPSPLYGVMAGLTARAGNDVWAAGYYIVGTTGQTLVEHWDGSAWSVMPSSNIGTSELYGLALSPGPAGRTGDTRSAGGAGDAGSDGSDGSDGTAGGIWAVGYYAVTANGQTLTEHYYGSCASPTPTPIPPSPTATATATPTCQPGWGIVPSQGSTVGDSRLQGVGAVAANDIWAVGSAFSACDGQQPFTEHWDGVQWSAVPSASPGAGTNGHLDDVAVVATNDVWAIGSYFGAQSRERTLIEHWDGTQWSIVLSPNSVSGYSLLYGATAISANNVWAVGVTNGQTLIEHWDGARWSIILSPNGGSGSSVLEGVAAISANDVWAVGYYGGYMGGGHTLTLTLHWDGTQWSIVPSSNPGGSSGANYMSAVVAISASDAWAVGTYGTGSENPNRTLTEHWDGQVWTVVPSPNIGSSQNSLVAVAVSAGAGAGAANNVWAVGYHLSNGPQTQTLTEHWNGVSWSVVPSRDASLQNNMLQGVAAVSPSNVWAVGTTLGSTIVEHNTDTIVDVQPSDYFYQAVNYLFCHGVVSGYADGTFRPYNNTTRGQLTKIVALAEGWAPYTPATPDFADVPASNPFYTYVETANHHGVISGYSCGSGCREFRPNNNVSRGQLSKVIVLARGWTLYTPLTPTFRDVPSTDPFYANIETAYLHTIITGYSCGPGCLEFRQGNGATRGQISKIVYFAITHP